MRKRFVQTLQVFQSPLSKSRGWVFAGHFKIPCSLGRTGTSVCKREGDGKTPKGIFALHQLWWRDDKFMHPVCGLKKRRTRTHDGWCDDVTSPRYNKPVLRPFTHSHEEMHRDDHVYDYVIEVGCNMQPVKRGRGSAIFLHLARDNFEPTAGCVAISREKITRLLALIGAKTRIRIR